MKRIGELEKKYVLDVLDGQFATSRGAKYMTKLEDVFSRKFESNFSIAQVNGTTTLHSAIEAMGIGIGDEVIVPPLTMASTSLAVLQANATPVFADVDIDTFVISASEIEKMVTERTKAIITVALFGLAPDMTEIMKIAKKYNLYVIEDNAQAFLSYQKGKLVGTFGDCASYSFQSSKHLSCGEGGIITVNDESLAVKIRKVANLGYSTIGSKKATITKNEIQHPSFLRHNYMAWNYRLGELNCAVALAQVERLEELVNIRKDNARILLNVVEKCNWLIPQKVTEENISSYWAFTCKLDIELVSWDAFREKFLEFGGDKYYGTWQLTYLEPLFKERIFGKREKFISNNFDQISCPVAVHLQPRLLQFKTNYTDKIDVLNQADILSNTISFFDKKMIG